MSERPVFDPLSGPPAFPLRNKLARVVWMAAWLVLARWTPPPLHGWRRFVLRLFGAQIGAGTRIYASVSVWLPRNLVIGERCLVGPGVRLYNQGRITIGDRCVISQRAHLCASTHDHRDPAFPLVTRPVAIGDGCWIAAEAFVGPGATMEEEAVLGARGVLNGTAEAGAIYAGNPAIKVGDRGGVIPLVGKTGFEPATPTPPV